MANPPLHTATNIARVEMVYNYASSICENVYHVFNTSGWTRAKLVTLVGQFASWESVTAKAQRNVDVTLDHIKATDITSSSGAFYQESEGIVGTYAGEALPPSSTFAVKMDTGVAGRSFRGRTYWIGLAGGMLAANPNNLSTTEISAILSALNTLLSTLSTAVTPLHVTSFRHANDWRLTAVTTPVIGFVAADSFVDNQRRRLLGHNRHR